MNIRQQLAGMFAVSLIAFLGCKPPPPSNTAIPQAVPKTQVFAQGQILPKGGIIQLSSAPGDIVEEVKVQVGEDVPAGTELVIMRSAALREKQLKALQAQRVAAQQEANQKITQASQQVRVAQAKLENVTAKEASLPRKAELLDVAGQQLKAAEEILGKLVNISRNQLTREFIGELEIDRQKMAVREAELKFRQQKETYDQAVEDVALARKAAQIELEVAQELWAAAKEFSPVQVIDAQIDTLQQEIQASKILAPVAGRILAINVQRGEAGIPQIPIIEMADLSAMVVEVEINERDASRVQAGQTATISSRALDQELTGKVDRLFPLVGRPQLKPLDPLARKDYRTKVAVIELDNAAEAKQWLQLQVDAIIDTPESTND